MHWLLIFVAWLTLPIGILYFLLGLDDLFIDLYARIKCLGPKRLSKSEFNLIAARKEKRIAIMVASWKEMRVLSAMVQGNSKRLLYDNFDFFLGVYPNDESTVLESRNLEKEYSNVHIVTNSKSGPTTKGQMLNEVVRSIFDFERQTGAYFEAFLLHDAEDIIHARSLKLINWQLESYDFIQIPIFSLPVKIRQFVAAIYVDEFAESHLKDIFVRREMNLPLPSAGVGTTLSRQLVVSFLERFGTLLNQATVTEDYELGMRAGQLGFKSTFACYYSIRHDSSRDFIATREYFPKSFFKSISQKSRWTLGIAFQGRKSLGWTGSLAQKYFLFRDRKGPLAYTVVSVGMALTLAYFALWEFNGNSFSVLSDYYSQHGMSTLIVKGFLVFNFILMTNRFIQRTYFTVYLYGFRLGLFVLPRMIIGNVINGLASMRACYQFYKSEITGLAPKWAKTEHELPLNFADGNIRNDGVLHG